MSSGITDRDIGYAALVAALKEIGRSAAAVYIGLPGESTDAETLIAAASNEFGTDTIPERSFLRSTVDENAGAYLSDLAEDVVRVAEGRGSNLTTVLKRTGQRASDDVKRKIVSLRSPPNAAATVAKKGSDNPLIDTGRLLQSITYKVEV